MLHKRFLSLSLLVTFLVTIAGTPSFAGTYLVQDGVDTAPYSFIPTLPRWTSTTLYAYTADPDDDGLSHNFETFIRFNIPPDLIPENEQVTSALFFII